jgi:hypothetical protein
VMRSPTHTDERIDAAARTRQVLSSAFHIEPGCRTFIASERRSHDRCETIGQRRQCVVLRGKIATRSVTNPCVVLGSDRQEHKSGFLAAARVTWREANADIVASGIPTTRDARQAPAARQAGANSGGQGDCENAAVLFEPRCSPISAGPDRSGATVPGVMQ